ncbi:hypothetical protein CKJ90_32865, partial [Klebsiella pneumoniae]
LDFAGWRLRLTRPTSPKSQLALGLLKLPGLAASGTVSLISPGGGCALPGLPAPNHNWRWGC